MPSLPSDVASLLTGSRIRLCTPTRLHLHQKRRIRLQSGHSRLSHCSPTPTNQLFRSSKQFVCGSSAIGSRVVTNGTTWPHSPAKSQGIPVLPMEKQGTVKICSSEGTNTALEVVLSFLDKDGNEIAPLDVSKFEHQPWKVVEGDAEKVKGVYWQGSVLLPEGAQGDLLVVRIKGDSKVDMEFLNEIEISAGDFNMHFTPNSWVHRNSGGRVFFSSQLALLPQDTPKELQEWRQAELDSLKGSRIDKGLTRQPWDRIYNYDTYNDLAGPKDDRPVIGGSEEFPYPRRLRTGRPRVKALNGEVFEVRDPQPFWSPLDEQFDKRSEGNTLAYTVMSRLPAQKLRAILTQTSFNSFDDVDKLYAQLSQPVISISDKGMDGQADADWGENPVVGVALGGVKEALKQAGALPEPLAAVSDDVVGEANADWTKNPFLAGILEGVEEAVTQVGGLAENLGKFPPPAVWQQRPREWTKDEEWGRQALAGENPCFIRAVHSLSQLGSITADVLAPHLEGHTLKSLLFQSRKSPRLLVIDHTEVYEDYAERISQLEGRYGYSGRAVLYRRDDNCWVPIAVELKAGGDGEVDVYTPADHPNLWLLAKGVFTSVDNAAHQLVSHLLRSHSVTEPYIISARRNLSVMHPVFQLMMPHFAHTITINSVARVKLTAAKTAFETVFTTGEYTMRVASGAYKTAWRFDQQGLPADLIQRGLAVKEAGALKLLLDDYPYADDGMLLWTAFEKWVDGYLRLYYDDRKAGKRISDDHEIMAWWREIITVGHADKKEGWPALHTISDLTKILTTMIWTVTGHHSAVNHSGYAYSGYVPNRPTICHKRIPKRGSPEHQELISSKAAGEKAYMDTLMDLDRTLQWTFSMAFLSNHPEDEVYIGEPNHQYIRDPRALQLYSNLVKDLQETEKIIESRNSDPSRKMRSTPGLPYTFMDPTSQSGLTNRGVPQSITI